ncbi:MAG: hypothetical protein ABJM43_10895 [Paracoccaceae bacterium]
MTLSHLYQNFGDQKPPKQTSTNESRDAVEDEKLQSFEDGYKAGWEDAVNAQSQARDHIDNEFAKSLQEISFSFHEARMSLKKEIGEVMEPIFLKLLPTISHETLVPKVIEYIQDLANQIAERPIEVAVSPNRMVTMQSAFEEQIQEPFTILPDEGLEKDQVFIRVGNVEHAIDLETWNADIHNLISSHLEFSQKD